MLSSHGEMLELADALVLTSGEGPWASPNNVTLADVFEPATGTTGEKQYFIPLKDREKNRKLNELLDELQFKQLIIFREY
ncbi:hypothetical protein B0H63DRAFT_519223 [Podospora didyma]|uniref:Uncharacterized protein n=1 Tax=Podospora didyma TaxID=330526 RepID=A0AAE0NYD5_9PEZI|nr:hypothetical protein B0H63DRAFT_519223 [Podospora didyma]